MKSLLKVISIIVSLVIFTVLLYKISSTPEPKYELAVPKVEPEEEIKLITTETPLFFDAKLIETHIGFNVTGTTNLPEGTKLGASLYRNNNTIAQNFDIYVMDGQFIGKFGTKMYDNDYIELVCIENNSWQKDWVINQLKFIESDRWQEEVMGRELNYTLKLSK